VQRSGAVDPELFVISYSALGRQSDIIEYFVKRNVDDNTATIKFKKFEILKKSGNKHIFMKNK
jgi:hypothetical protein